MPARGASCPPPVRLRGDVGRVDARRSSLLTVTRKARLRSEHRCVRSRTRSVQHERSRGAAQGHLQLADCLAEGVQPARPGSSRCCVRTPSRQAAHADGASRPTRILPPDRRALQRTRVRRFSERRHRQGHPASRSGKASSSSSTSSATPPPAWRPTRARHRTCLRSGSCRRRWIARFPTSARRHFGRPIRRSRSARWSAQRVARCSIRCGRRRSTPGRPQNGAVFENVGLWRRARYFPQDGEDMHAAVARECKAVRASVGIFDATTLGKIEVVGRMRPSS